MNTHLIIIIGIMVVAGSFGGYLNFLHKFDTAETDVKDDVSKTKYILLGIGAALLVPAFLKMISSNLANSKDPNDYLIFAGFCLIAAIFSRRFINTLGEKILEAAKNAEQSAKENKQKIETTQQELSTARERIEDVKLAVDIKNTQQPNQEHFDEGQKEVLLELTNAYIEKTSVPDRSQRLKMKAELGRKTGEIIVRNNFIKEELWANSQSEGMILALSYAVQLRPDDTGLEIIKAISKQASQLYTKYSILIAIDTLARNSYISAQNVSEVSEILKDFKKKADSSLLRKINDTQNILGFFGTADNQ